MSDDTRPGWRKKPPVHLPTKPTGGRVDFDPKAFEQLLKEKGVRVRVYRTVFCPNVKSIDGAEHNIDCQLCNGSGFLDTRPIDTVAFIQNQGLEKMQFAEGMVDGNSVAASFPTGVELQYFTLVELEDFTEIYFQRVKRQEGDVDVLKYRAHSVNLCIDQNGIEYFQDNDFKLDPNGSIRWIPNKGPNPGDIYSIHFEASVQFRAVRAMHTNRFTQVLTRDKGGGAYQLKLPEQWALQKEFLVKRKDRDGNEIFPNLIHDKTEPDAPEED